MTTLSVWLLVLSTLTVATLSGCARAPQVTAGRENLPLSEAYSTLPETIEAVRAFVVRVNASGAGSNSFGSGFIVDSRGYVLTNNHVVDKATQVTVVFADERSYDASLVSSDPGRDLALLNLNASGEDFAAAKLGSSAAVVPGQEVVTAGFPLGNLLPGPPSFHKGIVSALRSVQGQKYIQTDAIMNPGNSGGPLVDLKGAVIGITVSGVVPPSIDAEGIGLCIPMDEARAFLDKSLPR